MPMLFLLLSIFGRPMETNILPQRLYIYYIISGSAHIKWAVVFAYVWPSNSQLPFLQLSENPPGAPYGLRLWTAT